MLYLGVNNHLRHPNEHTNNISTGHPSVIILRILNIIIVKMLINLYLMT